MAETGNGRSALPLQSWQAEEERDTQRAEEIGEQPAGNGTFCFMFTETAGCVFRL
ncbi:MAG: hypothetical protein IKS32_08545 [Solobacterium sp.]|nr:hypothetical protein [Solobacterium sp.]